MLPLRIAASVGTRPAPPTIAETTSRLITRRTRAITFRTIMNFNWYVSRNAALKPFRGGLIG